MYGTRKQPDPSAKGNANQPPPALNEALHMPLGKKLGSQQPAKGK